MHNITFVIFTYNEERRIERVIRNYKDFGNIILADDSSTDKTTEIANSYGCKIYTREKPYVVVENQELLKALYPHIDTEWIFWGYADEMMNKQTLIEIKSIISSNKYDIIRINRKNYFYGEKIYNLYQSGNNRIFKKYAIDFSNNIIHGFGKPTVNNNRIYALPNKYFIHQFINYTATSYLNSVNRYTDIEIEFHKIPKKTIWFFLFRIAKNLIKDYFITGGYKAGFPGIAITELTIFYELIKNLKIYEKVNDLDRTKIETKNDFYRDLILKEFE